MSYPHSADTDPNPSSTLGIGEYTKEKLGPPDNFGAAFADNHSSMMGLAVTVGPPYDRCPSVRSYSQNWLDDAKFSMGHTEVTASTGQAIYPYPSLPSDQTLRTTQPGRALVSVTQYYRAHQSFDLGSGSSTADRAPSLFMPQHAIRADGGRPQNCTGQPYDPSLERRLSRQAANLLPDNYSPYDWSHSPPAYAYPIPMYNIGNEASVTAPLRAFASSTYSGTNFVHPSIAQPETYGFGAPAPNTICDFGIGPPYSTISEPILEPQACNIGKMAATRSTPTSMRPAEPTESVLQVPTDRLDTNQTNDTNLSVHFLPAGTPDSNLPAVRPAPAPPDVTTTLNVPDPEDNELVQCIKAQLSNERKELKAPCSICRAEVPFKRPTPSQLTTVKYLGHDLDCFTKSLEKAKAEGLERTSVLASCTSCDPKHLWSPNTGGWRPQCPNSAANLRWRENRERRIRERFSNQNFDGYGQSDAAGSVIANNDLSAMPQQAMAKLPTGNYPALRTDLGCSSDTAAYRSDASKDAADVRTAFAQSSSAHAAKVLCGIPGTKCSTVGTGFGHAYHTTITSEDYQQENAVVRNLKFQDRMNYREFSLSCSVCSATAAGIRRPKKSQIGKIKYLVDSRECFQTIRDLATSHRVERSSVALLCETCERSHLMQGNATWYWRTRCGETTRKKERRAKARRMKSTQCEGSTHLQSQQDAEWDMASLEATKRPTSDGN